MSAAAPFEQALGGLAAEVERALERALPPSTAEPRELIEAMRYAVLGGGKRVRPAIALWSAEAAGGEVGRARAWPFACALECIHVYSLVHDDLPAMDDDDLRRGRPTCHRVFGEAMAILAGDALLTYAFELAAGGAPAGLDSNTVDPARAARAVAELARAAGPVGMVGGQVLDLRGEGRTAITPGGDEKSLVAIHRWKTAALIRAAAVGGAIVGGGDERAVEAARAYGEAVGLAFQVTDDILDCTQPTEVLGKTAGKDARAGKLTYPAVLGLDGARARAAALTEEALTALAALPPSPPLERLAQLATFVRDRTR